MDSLAQGAEKRFSGFVTRTTKRTTAPGAKLVAKFLRTAVYPGYWDRTGRAPSKNLKLSHAAKPRAFPYTWIAFGLRGSGRTQTWHRLHTSPMSYPKCEMEFPFLDRVATPPTSAPTQRGDGIRGQRYFRSLAAAHDRHLLRVARIGQHQHERTVRIFRRRVIHARSDDAIGGRCNS
jgi:hypothetical protein